MCLIPPIKYRKFLTPKVSSTGISLKQNKPKKDQYQNQNYFVLHLYSFCKKVDFTASDYYFGVLYSGIINLQISSTGEVYTVDIVT